MLKKPLNVAGSMMTNKLKAASSKLEIGSVDTINSMSKIEQPNTISNLDSNSTSTLEVSKKNGHKQLEEEIWFHGVLPRLEVVRLLQEDGDFLVRETVRNEEKQIVLSVMWSSPKHFIVQTSPEGLFR